MSHSSARFLVIGSTSAVAWPRTPSDVQQRRTKSGDQRPAGIGWLATGARRLGFEGKADRTDLPIPGGDQLNRKYGIATKRTQLGALPLAPE